MIVENGGIMLHIANIERWVFRAILCVPLAICAEDRPNLSGAWQLNLEKSDRSTEPAGLTWVIDLKDDTVHMAEVVKSSGGKVAKLEYDCTIDGKECAVHAKGQPQNVSFWYNGGMLVELVSAGHNHERIVKRRMRLSGDGKVMQVEWIPVAGGGHPANLVFEKQ
jgi:hypothetical protein